MASLASLPLTLFGSEAANSALSTTSFASYLALTSAKSSASLAAAALFAALMAYPFFKDSADAISAADLVVDTPYYGAKDDGLFPIMFLLSPGRASPPSIAEA